MKILSKIIDELYDNLYYFKIDLPIDLENYKKFTEFSVLVGFLNKINKNKNNYKLNDFSSFINHELNKLNCDDVLNNNYLPYHITFPYFSIRDNFPIARYEKYLNIIHKYNFFPPEIPPHREMEWQHFELKFNKISKVKGLKNCILNQQNYMLNFNRDLAYSFTHSLFYIYDFGFAKINPGVKHFRSIKFQTECLIVKYYNENDIDILLELSLNYFGFYSFNDINIQMLDFLEVSLIKNNFFNFSWKENNNIEKVYHSYLVLGILCCLFDKILSDRNISDKKKEKLKNKLDKSVIFGSDFDLNSLLTYDKPDINETIEYKTWQILQKSIKKDFNINEFKQFEERFGHNKYLNHQIKYNLNILLDRNNMGILFESEFNYLSTTTVNEEILKLEYSKRLKDAIVEID